MTPPKSPTLLEEAREVPERALRLYARLWQFETWLRTIVYVELRALHGDGWSASLRGDTRPFDADKRLTHMPTREMNALSYVQLSQLMTLIEEHWDCFALYLPPKSLWDAKLKEVLQIRHRIAHFRAGHADDHARVLQLLRDVDHGFWTFCTSYNDGRPVLPPDRDPVTKHFIGLDPLPWGEFEPNQWARIGVVDRSEVVNVLVNVLRRPWAKDVDTVDCAPGRIYDILLRGGDRRVLDYRSLLERTKATHDRLVHIALDTGGAVRLTIPAVLGSAAVIELVETWLAVARQNVRRGSTITSETANAIAAEWPEYVLGPGHPLAYLGPDMPCSFFDA
ncbi:hypothetical protein JIX59_10440 [Brevundimonas diminuta]|uniref:hypothetical protein n=1 Tax=Brevundimonas diminuta TaxID=293 RepID=UPI001907E325|nr:hypothetical protein [Brevundimonas diminuta]MBK1969756.1 hypothetical protein [Brevundimonas diminuta]MDA0743213.1 hypothetical protein [Pseudomonadota bacterium]MDA1321214.1 hypothetical protein [Pseudomonadota bacterium]